MFFRAVSFLVAICFLICCGSPDPKVWEDYAKAKVCYSQGRIDESVSDLGALTARDAAFAPGRLLYGRALFFHRDYDKAREVLSSLQNDHPESVEASLWLVRTLVQLNKPGEAEAILVRLLAFNPDDPRLAYQMALIRENRSDLGGAKDFLVSAEGADEDLALIHFESARLSFQLHNADLARAELTRALGFLSPTSLLRKPIEKLRSNLSPPARTAAEEAR